MKSPEHSTVTLVFDHPEAAKHFQSWLSGAGEQDYWEWMSCQDMAYSAPLTATRFHYQYKKDNPEILCDCEVLDK